jgi:hypothetical protein
MAWAGVKPARRHVREKKSKADFKRTSLEPESVWCSAAYLFARAQVYGDRREVTIVAARVISALESMEIPLA